MSTRDRIADLYGDAVFLEPSEFDEAIVGVVERFGAVPVVCYDRAMVIDIIARDMPREDAEEYFEFNTIGAWMGEFTPVFLDTRIAD